MVEILSMDIRRLENETQYHKAMCLVSEGRRKIVQSFRNPQSARLSLAAGVLLFFALERYGLAKKQDQIKLTKYGKPFIEGEGIYFNLSHSGYRAICAFGAEPIGVDIQQMKKELPKHLHRILSDEEQKYLFFLEEAEKVTAFYRLWARKESFIKWDGRGLRLPLQMLSFVQNGIWADEILYEHKKAFVREYLDFLPDYAVCICSLETEYAKQIEEILIIP